jgi:hypothetical protein
MARPYRRGYEAALPRLLAEPRRAQVWQRLRRDVSR